MVDCKKLTKQPCLSNPQQCTWEVGKGCRNNTSVLSSTTAPPASQSTTVPPASQSTTAPPVSQSANSDMIYNPATKRYVKKSGKVGQSLLKASQTAVAAAKTKSASPKKSSSSPPKKSASTPPKKSSSSSPKKSSSSSPKKSSSPAAARNSSSPDRLQKLQKQMDEARKNRDIKSIINLTQLIQEEVKKQKEKKKADIPDFLNQCIDPTTKDLPTLPTTMGDSDMKEFIKDENNLIIIDGLCYDIKELYELIKVDISQGNLWGCNPYVKREGLIMPFSKDVKEKVLSEGIKRGILPKGTKWEDRTPLHADDKELQGYYTMTEKRTPLEWKRKGWASDGTAFPTPEYYAITFHFPYRKRKQNPGQTVIFPKTKEWKEFIDKKLIPVYEAGALWSKKISVTEQVLVINPNIHMVFEDNQPWRWHSRKMQDLEEEISRYAPAYL